MKRAAFLLLLASCADDVPATPSYQQDVMPILRANCGRCHTYPQIGGAPTYIRLTFSEQSSPEWSMLMKERVVAGSMPPRLELDEHQIETIARWADQGGQRGTPRPGNRPPAITHVEAVVRGVMIDLHDPDGDLVGGYLLDSGVITTEVTQGRNLIALEPGNHHLSLEVDDGGASVTLDIGDVMVTP